MREIHAHFFDRKRGNEISSAVSCQSAIARLATTPSTWDVMTDVNDFAPLGDRIPIAVAASPLVDQLRRQRAAQ